MPDGLPWPRLTIVTPSYNQGQFIEESIRSVLLQGYPNLEYIITDGGSTDGSVDIIRKYEPWLAYWQSKPDRGQSHALNKGFARATGHIFAWLNSDDYYYPGVVGAFTRALLQRRDVSLVHGFEHHVDVAGHIVQTVFPVLRDARATTLYVGRPLLQLTCFWLAEAHRALGGLDESLHCHLDYDFFLKLSYQYKSRYVAVCAGGFRRYPGQKSQMQAQSAREYHKVREAAIARIGLSPWRYKVWHYFYNALALWKTQGASGFGRAVTLRLHRLLSRGRANGRGTGGGPRGLS